MAPEHPVVLHSSQRQWGLAALNLAALAIVVVTYFSSGLQDAPVSIRYSLVALPTAVTMIRGIANDSTSASELTSYFVAQGAGLNDRSLRESLTVPVLRPDDRAVAIKSDDLGLSRFVRAAFAIFGVSLGAPHKLFFLLLGASLLVFNVSAIEQPIALALSLCAICGLYSVEFVLRLSSQLLTAVDVRVIGVLAIIPCLHLCLGVLEPPRSKFAIAAFAAQAGLLAAVFQIRSSSSWSSIAVAVVTVVALGRAVMTKEAAPPLPRWIPLMVLSAVLLGVTAYERSRLAPVFQTTNTSQHVFWHPVHVGFAVNPVLAREYGLAFDDTPAHRQVFRYLNETDLGLARRVFGGDGRTYDYETINWRWYDAGARRVVLHIVWQHPVQALATFVYYKPLIFFKTLRWAAGRYHGPVDTLAMSPNWLMTDAERAKDDAYLRLLRPLPVLLCVVGAFILAGVSRSSPIPALSASNGVMLMTGVMLAALVPGFLAYPAFHWVGDALVLVCGWVYLLATIAMSLVFRGLGFRPQVLLAGLEPIRGSQARND